MNQQQRAVKEFHELIGAPVGSRPMIPSPERRELRINLIWEELLEFAEASNFVWEDGDEYALGYFANEDTYRGQPDLVTVADALGDLLVVLNGAGLEWGLDLEPIFDEIHRSNMTKGGGETRADGKALKGPDYQPPVLEPIIQRQMARDEWDDYPENWIEIDPRYEVRLIGVLDQFALSNNDHQYQPTTPMVYAHRDPGDETNA